MMANIFRAADLLHYILINVNYYMQCTVAGSIRRVDERLVILGDANILLLSLYLFFCICMGPMRYEGYYDQNVSGPLIIFNYNN